MIENAAVINMHYNYNKPKILTWLKHTLCLENPHAELPKCYTRNVMARLLLRPQPHMRGLPITVVKEGFNPTVNTPKLFEMRTEVFHVSQLEAIPLDEQKNIKVEKDDDVVDEGKLGRRGVFKKTLDDEVE